MRRAARPLRDAALLAGALTLAGCVVGPDYRRPEVRPPAAYLYPAGQDAALADTDWWKSFGDPVLDTLIAEALAHNRSVKIAAANVEQAAGVLQSTRSAFYPQVGYQAAGGRNRFTNDGLTAQASGLTNPTNYYQALAGASWEIDLWGRVQRLSESAQANVLATEAARRTLALLPGFPLAHFLAATVHVARGAFDEATRELRAGIASAEMRGADEPRFSGVALHWLLGLVLAESDDLAGALTALEHECALEGSRHLYGRECVANSWYAIGALRLRSGDRAGAGAAFGEAERRMPRHPGAAIGLVLLDGRGLEDLARRGAESEHLSATDRAMGLACVCGASALAGRPLPPGVGMELAAAAVDAALSAAEPGNAGWLLPVEPLIHPSGAPDVWSAALSRLRGRAA